MSEKDFCKDANGVNASVKAQQWANELVRREARGPGDMENAMRRLESRYGIPWRMFWSLRYRPPTDVLTGLYFKLHDAYRAECGRQMRKLEHEIAITKIIAGPDDRAVRAAETILEKATSKD